VVVSVLVATAIVVRRVWLNDSARVIGTDEAVQRFRTVPTPVPTTMPTTMPTTDLAAVGTVIATIPGPDTALHVDASVPDPGVYRYLTDGSEHIDVLGGATHAYPAETTLTVVPDGCGVVLRWDLLMERREEWRLCAAIDGIVLQATGAYYHEFFAHGELEQLTCNQSVLLVPLDGLPRSPVPLKCTLNEREWLPVWEVLDRSTRQVEGAQVPVTHVRMTVDDNDDYHEHTLADYWLDDHGLPVEMTAAKESKSSSGLVGDVVYQEHYVVTLASTSPLR
jgi:hypothetical protein